MPRNVELKARLDNPKDQHALAAALADSPPQVIEQVDIFFNVPRGRLIPWVQLPSAVPTGSRND